METLFNLELVTGQSNLSPPFPLNSAEDLLNAFFPPGTQLEDAKYIAVDSEAYSRLTSDLFDFWVGQRYKKNRNGFLFAECCHSLISHNRPHLHNHPVLKTSEQLCIAGVLKNKSAFQEYILSLGGSSLAGDNCPEGMIRTPFPNVAHTQPYQYCQTFKTKKHQIAYLEEQLRERNLEVSQLRLREGKMKVQNAINLRKLKMAKKIIRMRQAVEDFKCSNCRETMVEGHFCNSP